MRTPPASPQTQEPQPLSTDRPDFTESTAVVGANVVQFENGFTLTRQNELRNLAGAELLLRVGITNRLELRLGGTGYVSETVEGNSARRGYSDEEIGLKIKIADERRLRPAFSILPILSLPTGSANFSSGAYNPTLVAAIGKRLPGGFTLGSNISVGRTGTREDSALQRTFSVVVNHGLAAKVDMFAEVYTLAPWDVDEGDAWIADAGLLRAFGNNTQVDVRFGKRMSSTGPDTFFGVGFAVRQPVRLFVR